MHYIVVLDVIQFATVTKLTVIFTVCTFIAVVAIHATAFIIQQ